MKEQHTWQGHAWREVAVGGGDFYLGRLHQHDGVHHDYDHRGEHYCDGLKLDDSQEVGARAF